MTRISPVFLCGAAIVMLCGTVSAQSHAFEDVVRNLRNPDPKARLSALQMLHESQYIEAAVPIAPLVNDPIDEIQLEAIAAEMSFYLVEDIPVRSKKGFIVEVRSKGHAMQAFNQGPLATWPHPVAPEVVDALLKAVDDENPRVRTEAIYALGVVGRAPLAPEPSARLVKVLDHYDPPIRAAAARVIGRLQVKSAGPALVSAINDSNEQVRYAAMRALGDLREPQSIEALTEQFKYYGKGEGAWSALDALARIGYPSSGPLFRSRIADKDEYIRRAAIEGLARIADAADLPTLSPITNTEQSVTARAALMFAMVRLGQNYLSRLVDLLGNDRVASQVQEYLLELGPSVVPSLAPHLQDPDAGVRRRLVQVMGALGDSRTVTVIEPLTKDRDRGVAEAAAYAVDRIKMSK